MKKKILLVGLGNMGMSHLKSFKNKYNFKLYIYDKYLNNNQILKKIINIKSDIEIIKNLPKKKYFDYLILCNHSRDRYSTLKKIISKNRINYILLEKFVFLKKKHYENIINYIGQGKVIVNVWGGILFRLLKMNLIKRKKNNISVYLPEGTMLTNLIHYFYFFSLFSNEKIHVEKKITKIISSKRKKYHELIGKIILKTKKNFMTLSTKKRIKNFNLLIIKNKKKTIKVKIQIPKILYYPKKFFNFPVAQKITKNNFDILENKIITNSKKFRLPRLEEIQKVSILILKEFSLINKKKIFIN